MGFSPVERPFREGAETTLGKELHLATQGSAGEVHLYLHAPETRHSEFLRVMCG